jgi:hypothetical protein
MKRSTLILNSCASLTLVIGALVWTTGCSRSSPLKFSAVLEGGFDPIAMFRQSGFKVETQVRGEGIRNPVKGYGWQSWCGVITSERARGNGAIAALVRDELNRVIQGSSLDELTIREPDSPEEPLSGMLRYNSGQAHGDMHVWLVPGISSNTVSYVIFVREERLK